MNDIVDARVEKLTVIGKELDEMVGSTGMSYMDACVDYCHKYNVEIELLGELIKGHQRISAEIKGEAEELHYLSKDSSYTVNYE